MSPINKSSIKDKLFKLQESTKIEKGVIPKEFAEANEKMGDFRNKIIHDYDRINDEQAYKYAEKAPEIFKTFSKSFVDFIEKK
jgi:uncharacterized protein YutE (UPF0331/DUF86 family)